MPILRACASILLVLSANTAVASVPGPLPAERVAPGEFDSLDDLSPEAQITLVNAYHRANAALADGEFDPIVCRRLLRTGSKFKKISCAHQSGLRERGRIEKEAIVAAVAAPRLR